MRDVVHICGAVAVQGLFGGACALPQAGCGRFQRIIPVLHLYPLRVPVTAVSAVIVAAREPAKPRVVWCRSDPNPPLVVVYDIENVGREFLWPSSIDLSSPAVVGVIPLQAAGLIFGDAGLEKFFSLRRLACSSARRASALPG